MYAGYKYFMIYNDVTNLDVFTQIVARPSKHCADKLYDEIKIPFGKTLYIDRGFSDVQIIMDMNFMSSNAELWDDHWREIKRWLLGKGNQKLKFSDDLRGYYKVNKVSIPTSLRQLKRTGTFTVVFTCDPYFYIEDEEVEIVSGEPIYNDFDLDSRPIYRIVGDGELTLKVNGKTIKVNVGQETTINCDLGLCYRDGVINNSSLTGNYEDLYLKANSDNTFEWTDEFKVYIQPMWRCL